MIINLVYLFIYLDALRNNDTENELTYDFEERYSDDDALVIYFEMISDTDDFLFPATDTDDNEANEFYCKDQQFDGRKIMFVNSKSTVNDVMTLVLAF